MMKKLLNYFGNLTERRFFVAMFVAAVGLVLSLALLHFALLNSSEFLFDPNSAGKMPWLAKKFIVLLCVVALVLPTVAMSRFFFANKDWVLAHRIHVLVFAGAIGLACALGLVYGAEFLTEQIGVVKIAGAVEKFVASLCVIVLGLPTLGMLWFFRTNDTREQIQKTKESTDVNILFGAQKMLFGSGATDDRSTPEIAAGFAQLMHLRGDGSLQSMIDLATGGGVKLARLDLTSLPLRGVNLESASMKFANLSNVDLTNSNLSGAELGGAKLQKAILLHVNLKHAALVSAFLQKANLQNAILTNADLKNANLQNADLRDATLSETILIGANLQETDLRGVDLRRAIWQKTRGGSPEESDADFGGARYSASTKFPLGFDRKKFDMKEEE